MDKKPLPLHYICRPTPHNTRTLCRTLHALFETRHYAACAARTALHAGRTPAINRPLFPRHFGVRERAASTISHIARSARCARPASLLPRALTAAYTFTRRTHRAPRHLFLAHQNTRAQQRRLLLMRDRRKGVTFGVIRRPRHHHYHIRTDVEASLSGNVAAWRLAAGLIDSVSLLRISGGLVTAINA